MERFDHLMDDIKEALILSNGNKRLFLPALLANILIIVLGIVMVVFFVAAMIGTVSAVSDFSMNGPRWSMIFGMIIGIVLFLIVFSIVFMALDIGITGLVIGLVDGERPSSSLFFGAIKNNLFPVFLTNLGLTFIYFFGFLLLLIPLVLYMLTVGVLTGGWGMIFLSCMTQTLLGYWVLIKMEDHRGGFESVGVNIRFGKNHFWLMILIIYMQISFAAFIPGLFGLIGMALASFFISYVVTTFYKIVVLLTYRRYRESV